MTLAIKIGLSKHCLPGQILDLSIPTVRSTTVLSTNTLAAIELQGMGLSTSRNYSKPRIKPLCSPILMFVLLPSHQAGRRPSAGKEKLLPLFQR